jgi:hypothetical protein
MKDRLDARGALDAAVIRGSGMEEAAQAHGRYEVTCVGRDGKVKWEDHFDNLVTVVGKNFALNTYLAGVAYTVTGPFMGLISSEGFAAGPSNADTMASHAGWNEAGGNQNPTYTGPRKTCAWSAAAAGAKSLSAVLAFAITSAGTVKGAFIVLGTGAVNVIDDANGTLYSAGLFAGGDKLVDNGDTLNCAYTASL